MAINRYAAGNKVYNGGSSAATRGTVDPQGYVERSLRQRNSQRRSGHAAAAMRRLDRNRVSPGERRRLKRRKVLTRKIQNTKPGQRRMNLRERRAEVRLRDMQPGQAKRQLRRKEQRLENRTDGRPGNNPGSDGSRPRGGGRNSMPGIRNTPQYPVVKISPNGQLNLPWNLQTNMGAVQAQGQFNQGLLNLQGQRQNYVTDWTREMRDAELDNDRQFDNTRNDFAARGLVQSSPYGQAVGQNQTAWNNYQSDMETDKANFMSQLAQNRLGIENQFNDTLRALGIENALSAEEQAGELGYGRHQAGAVGMGRNKKPGGGKKGDGKKKPKGRLSEGERRRLRRRRKLTRKIKNTKAGPRKRRLRERRLEVRLRDMEPGKAKRRVARKEDRLEDRRRREARRRKRRNNRNTPRDNNRRGNPSIPSLYDNKTPKPVTPRPRNPAGRKVSPLPRERRRRGSKKNAFR